MRLGDYASIRTGLVLSRKIASSKKEAQKYDALTLRAQTAEGYIDLNLTEPYLAGELLKRDYFTKPGDILLRLSVPYTATVITDENKDLLVSAHFSIIRTDSKEITPAFLAWWLTKNKKFFYQSASGTSMLGTISSGYIADMKFSPPPIERQRQAGALLMMMKREQQLLTKLAEEKKKLINAIINMNFQEDKPL